MQCFPRYRHGFLLIVTLLLLAHCQPTSADKLKFLDPLGLLRKPVALVKNVVNVITNAFGINLNLNVGEELKLQGQCSIIQLIALRCNPFTQIAANAYFFFDGLTLRRSGVSVITSVLINPRDSGAYIAETIVNSEYVSQVSTNEGFPDVNTVVMSRYDADMNNFSNRLREYTNELIKKHNGDAELVYKALVMDTQSPLNEQPSRSYFAQMKANLRTIRAKPLSPESMTQCLEAIATAFPVNPGTNNEKRMLQKRQRNSASSQRTVARSAESRRMSSDQMSSMSACAEMASAGMRPSSC